MSKVKSNWQILGVWRWPFSNPWIFQCLHIKKNKKDKGASPNLSRKATPHASHKATPHASPVQSAAQCLSRDIKGQVFRCQQTEFCSSVSNEFLNFCDLQVDFPELKASDPLERQGYREGASPPPTFPSACIPNSTFSSFLFTFSCECCTWVCMDDVYTRVWIHVHVHVHPCGGLRLMSENHSWCLIHLVHRGRVSHINPELAKMASLLPLPNFPDRNYSLAAMLTWQFVGFWESKLWSSYLCSRHFCR